MPALSSRLLYRSKAVIQNKTVEILLVEDNDDDLDLTMRALRKANVSNHIEAVRDGQEALDFLFGEGDYAHRNIANQPRVVLLDLKLPKIDGLEVLRILKQNELTRTIPVVILTSSREDRDISTAYDLGVNSYIVKPVNFESFSTAVAELGLYWLLLNQPHR
ncbi:MAG: response regulator, partial [Leptospiraceae bacterium]|nr:response regulator [Leptospiraceae bacterium]